VSFDRSAGIGNGTVTDPVFVTVPFSDETLEPPPAVRVRAFKRHLVQSLRALRLARRPDRLIQRMTPEPAGFTATVVQAGCATCQGHCCKGGGDHAYIDERTMARVRRNNPDLDARAVIGLFLEHLAPLAYRNSCLFHGAGGCTLGRKLRAELCNAYYCNGLQEFLQRPQVPERVQIIATRNGIERRSPILSPDDQKA
jgi:hypothetical protein